MKANTRFKKKWNSLSLPVQLLVIVASTLLPFLAFALGGWVFLALFTIFIASPFYAWFVGDRKTIISVTEETHINRPHWGGLDAVSEFRYGDD